MSVLPPAPLLFQSHPPQENLYSNGHLAKSLYLLLKNWPPIVSSTPAGPSNPEKQWLDAQRIYHKALKEMFKHFPKAVTPRNKNVCCLAIED